jgi:hypothetical protein
MRSQTAERWGGRHQPTPNAAITRYTIAIIAAAFPIAAINVTAAVPMHDNANV